MIANAAIGVALIGAVNLLVSFNLALWVALRARNIRFTRSILLMRALGRRFLHAPLDFLFGPRDIEALEAVDAAPGANRGHNK